MLPYKTLWANNDPIKIITQNSMGHVVENIANQSFAGAIYNASLTDFGWIHSVNVPVILAGQVTAGDVYELAFADPDLHRATAVSSDALTNSLVAMHEAGSIVEIRLKDTFMVLSNDPEVNVSQEGSGTLISAIVSSGKTYKVRLKRSFTANNSLVGNHFSCRYLNNKIFSISSTETIPFNISVLDLSGKPVMSKTDCITPWLLNLSNFPVGSYIFKIGNNENQQFFKQLIY